MPTHESRPVEGGSRWTTARRSKASLIESTLTRSPESGRVFADPATEAAFRRWQYWARRCPFLPGERTYHGVRAAYDGHDVTGLGLDHHDHTECAGVGR
ncbi:MAG: hypothetical protein ACRDN9_04790 [Streptosporangiaceae bacterium]